MTERDEALLTDRTDRLFIGGTWVSPSEPSQTTAVHSAADGNVLAEVPAAQPADVAAAVEAARTAARQWAPSTIEDRATALRSLRAAIEKHHEPLARLISLEVGTPVTLARRLQVGLPLEVLDRFAVAVEEMSFVEFVGNSTIWREPVGVVGAITPWNYPLHQVVAKFGAAIAAGCSMVVKPADEAPLSLFVLAEATRDAGLEPGLLNLVTGARDAGEALVANDDVDHVSFTGSTAVGAQVAAAVAGRIGRLTLELGGKSPSVVLEDADVDRAVKTSVNNAFLNSGQTCTAWSRLLVPRSMQSDTIDLARKAMTRLRLGHPLDEATRLGPLVSPQHAERVRSYIELGTREATLAAEGDVPEGLPSTGNYVPPVVFAGVPEHAAIAQEEIFGPVLSVMPYDSEDDAVRIANSTPYGLAAALWSADLERARQMAGKIRAGQVDINGAAFNSSAPFGGVKSSGLGRELGALGIQSLTEPKSIQE